mgnify:CR=1 FL=1
MSKNITIVGAGIAGFTLALELSSLNNVTLIEKLDIGGTCLNRGCIPTKTLLHLSSKTRDFTGIIEKCKRTIARLRKAVTAELENREVNIITDEAVLKSKNSVELLQSGKVIPFDILVMATGSRAKIPKVVSEADDAIIPEEVLELNRIPDEIVIVGGGYEGVEFATIFNNLGSNVTLIEREGSLLPTLSHDVTRYLTSSLSSKGIDVLTGKTISKVKENIVYLDDGHEVLYDKLLVCCGREPLEIPSKISFERKNGLIATNEFFETSQRNIFVIGDATGSMMFAHKAQYDATVLAKNILGLKEKPDYSAMPSCVFSNPQIAIVGSNNSGERIKVPFTAIAKSHCEDLTAGFITLHLDDYKNIIGAEVVHERASEMLSALTVIVSKKMSCRDVSTMIFAHPTLGEIIKEAAKRGLTA